MLLQLEDILYWEHLMQHADRKAVRYKEELVIQVHGNLIKTYETWNWPFLKNKIAWEVQPEQMLNPLEGMTLAHLCPDDTFKIKVWYLGNGKTLFCHKAFHRFNAHPPKKIGINLDEYIAYFFWERKKTSLLKTSLHCIGKSPIFLWRWNLQEANEKNH